MRSYELHLAESSQCLTEWTIVGWLYLFERELLLYE